VYIVVLHYIRKDVKPTFAPEKINFAYRHNEGLILWSA